MCIQRCVSLLVSRARASVESSMSSVKGFSGPASEKIKLFFIGHRRRSQRFDAYLDAGWCRSAFSDALLATLWSNRVCYAKRDGLSGRALRSAPQRGFCAALRLCWPAVCQNRRFEAVASVLQDASTSRVLALGFGWHRRDRLRPRDTRTSLHLTPAPATPSLRAETLRRASHQLPRADDRDSDSD